MSVLLITACAAGLPGRGFPSHPPTINPPPSPKTLGPAPGVDCRVSGSKGTSESSETGILKSGNRMASAWYSFHWGRLFDAVISRDGSRRRGECLAAREKRNRRSLGVRISTS